MDMSTRVRAAWSALGAALDGVAVDTPEFLEIVQRWLRTTAPAVSKHVRDGMPACRGIALVLDGTPGRLPMSRPAVEAWLRASQGQHGVDPRKFLAAVEQLAWDLAVYRDESDSCPQCQGSLELWTTTPPACELVLVCNLLGCTYAVDGTSRVPAGALVPADRATVRRVFPDAELVGSTVV